MDKNAYLISVISQCDPDEVVAAWNSLCERHGWNKFRDIIHHNDPELLGDIIEENLEKYWAGIACYDNDADIERLDRYFDRCEENDICRLIAEGDYRASDRYYIRDQKKLQDGGYTQDRFYFSFNDPSDPNCPIDFDELQDLSDDGGREYIREFFSYFVERGNEKVIAAIDADVLFEAFFRYCCDHGDAEDGDKELYRKVFDHPDDYGSVSWDLLNSCWLWLEESFCDAVDEMKGQG